MWACARPVSLMSTSRTNWSVGALTNEKLLVLRTLADMHDGNCERGKSSARDEPQALSTKDRKRVVRRALAKGARRAQLEISGTLSRGISCPLGHILLEDIRTFSLRSIDPARARSRSHVAACARVLSRVRALRHPNTRERYRESTIHASRSPSRRARTFVALALVQ